MLTDKDTGIRKFILDRLDPITIEAEDDPEYKSETLLNQSPEKR